MIWVSGGELELDKVETANKIRKGGNRSFNPFLRLLFVVSCI